MPRVEKVTAALLREWPLPEPHGDKTDRGDVHVVGGSPATPGAVLLAGVAALRVGAGRLAITTAHQVTTALAVAVPEAAVWPFEELRDRAEPDAFVVGPGLLAPDEVAAAVVAQCKDAALVIDAASLHDLPPGLPGRTVLTPNGNELRQLAGRDGEDDDLAVRVSGDRGVVVASCGWVAAPDGRLWHDDSGSVALATSGSGDVLAGAIGGLLARGAAPEQAACWGAHLHATAGAVLGRRLGLVGVLARDLADALRPGLPGLA
jgi:hydroxyethylthiazole kinase-like uncharacterized protein yjeF